MVLVTLTDNPHIGNAALLKWVFQKFLIPLAIASFKPSQQKSKTSHSVSRECFMLRRPYHSLAGKGAWVPVGEGGNKINRG